MSTVLHRFLFVVSIVLLIGIFYWIDFLATHNYVVEQFAPYSFSSPPPQANFGTNTWRTLFNAGQQLFDRRYKAPGLPLFPPSFGVTGEFVTDGPSGWDGYNKA